MRILKLYLIAVAMIAFTGCQATNNNLYDSLDKLTKGINKSMSSVVNSTNDKLDTINDAEASSLLMSNKENNAALAKIIPQKTSSSEVVSLLGEPMSKSRQEGYIVWFYPSVKIKLNSKGLVVVKEAIQ